MYSLRLQHPLFILFRFYLFFGGWEYAGIMKLNIRNKQERYILSFNNLFSRFYRVYDHHEMTSLAGLYTVATRTKLLRRPSCFIKTIANKFHKFNTSFPKRYQKTAFG
jgi:hypothetical protein